MAAGAISWNHTRSLNIYEQTSQILSCCVVNSWMANNLRNEMHFVLWWPTNIAHFQSECQIFSCFKNEQGTWGLAEKRQIYKLAFWVNSKPVKFASNSTLGKEPASTRARSCQESHELAWQGPRLLWQNPFSHNLDLTKAREKEIDIKCWASASRAQELQFSSEQTVLSGRLSGCSDWLETDEDKHKTESPQSVCCDWWMNLATRRGMSSLATRLTERERNFPQHFGCTLQGKYGKIKLQLNIRVPHFNSNLNKPHALNAEVAWIVKEIFVLCEGNFPLQSHLALVLAQTK